MSPTCTVRARDLYPTRPVRRDPSALRLPVTTVQVQYKTALLTANCLDGSIQKFLNFMVPGEGLEPSRPCGQRILSPLRLPIPPPRPVIESHVQHACSSESAGRLAAPEVEDPGPGGQAEVLEDPWDLDNTLTHHQVVVPDQGTEQQPPGAVARRRTALEIYGTVKSGCTTRGNRRKSGEGKSAERGCLHIGRA